MTILNLLILLALANIVVVAHLAGTAIATIDVGKDISKVRLFFGPRVAGGKIFGVSFEFGCIPTGGYIELTDKIFELGNNTLPAIRRIAIRVNGCIITFVLAALIMGISKSYSSVVAGFGQIVLGAIAPRSEGQLLLRGLLASISSGHFVYSLGVMAAKLTSLNLCLAACQVAVDQIGRSARYRKYALPTNMGITLGAGVLYVGWLIALLFSLRS